MNMLIFIIRNKKIWDLDASVYQNVIHIKLKKMSHESYENHKTILKNPLTIISDFFKYHHNWK